MSVINQPPAHESIVIETSMERFYAHRRKPHEMIILHPRTISGPFNALARHLLERHPCYGVAKAHDEMLQTLYSCEALEAMSGIPDALDDAMGLIVSDMNEMARQTGVQPFLRVIAPGGYAVGTYVYHEDTPKHLSALGACERLVCCYNGPTTEGLLEEDASFVSCGGDGPEYMAMPGAAPFRFGIGNIWRHACMGGEAPAFIHRAVDIPAGHPPRLMVVC